MQAQQGTMAAGRHTAQHATCVVAGRPWQAQQWQQWQQRQQPKRTTCACPRLLNNTVSRRGPTRPPLLALMNTIKGVSAMPGPTNCLQPTKYSAGILLISQAGNAGRGCKRHRVPTVDVQSACRCSWLVESPAGGCAAESRLACPDPGLAPLTTLSQQPWLGPTCFKCSATERAATLSDPSLPTQMLNHAVPTAIAAPHYVHSCAARLSKPPCQPFVPKLPSLRIPTYKAPACPSAPDTPGSAHHHMRSAPLLEHPWAAGMPLQRALRCRPPGPPCLAPASMHIP